MLLKIEACKHNVALRNVLLRHTDLLIMAQKFTNNGKKCPIKAPLSRNFVQPSWTTTRMPARFGDYWTPNDLVLKKNRRVGGILIKTTNLNSLTVLKRLPEQTRGFAIDYLPSYIKGIFFTTLKFSTFYAIFKRS